MMKWFYVVPCKSYLKRIFIGLGKAYENILYPF